MIISKTPLRISFFGGGTDYPAHFNKHGGAVLASGIDKFSYVTASQFPSHIFDYTIRISYRKVELAKKVSEIEHRVYKACLKFCNVTRDIELHNIADLPSFSGLGTSSSFTVGLLQVLHAFKNEKISPMELAHEAIHIEQNILKENVGCQDQVIAALGGLRFIEFAKNNRITHSPVNIKPARLRELESHILLVYTKLTRTASDVIVSQLKRIKSNTATLNQMRQMAEDGAGILTGNRDIREFGRLLNKAWELKRSLAHDVSNSKINKMYKTGIENGAIGGKLLGAGGGGFMLFLASPAKQKKLEKIFSGYGVIRVKLNAPGCDTILKS